MYIHIHFKKYLLRYIKNKKREQNNYLNTCVLDGLSMGIFSFIFSI